MEKYTLITGGSEGLGFEFAKIYASKGNNLILVARNYDKLIKAKRELSNNKIKIEIIDIDLVVENSCEKIKDLVDKNNIFVDRLINNAGIGAFGDFHNYSLDDIEKLIDLNVKSLTKLTYLILEKMLIKNQGEILNIASTAAFCAGPKMSVYYASKAYVLSLTEALHEEYKTKNIKICCLCPGALKTDFQKKSGIIKKAAADKLLMDAEKVALEGVLALEKGKAIAIPGSKNKLLGIFNKFIPRSLSRNIILKMNSDV